MFTPLHVCASFKPFFFLGIPVWRVCVVCWVTSCDLKLILFYTCTACITAKNCNPRNVTSVAVWIPSMQWPTSFCHWCYHGFSVTPNVLSRKCPVKLSRKKALQMKFIFVLERAIFMYCWMNSEIFMHNGQTFGQYSCTFTQVFIPYWNFEYTKAVTVHCGKSGRWYGVWYYNWSDSPLG